MNGWLLSPAMPPAGAARVAALRRGLRDHRGPLLRRLPMVQDAGSRLLVARNDLTRLRVAPDPDAPAARPLSPGQARLAVDRFALTANNITYAAFGETMHYWRFFSGDDAGWGCIPVWGHADVVESRADGVPVGARVYGYLPMGTHLVVQPGRVSKRGFVDAAAHRLELPAVYNEYAFCDPDGAVDRAAREALRALLQPLFTTSFLIDDFLADNDFFGARQVLLSSASSKTAFGTAHCLAQRDGIAIVGLTSPANRDATQRLGCYHSVHGYDALQTLDPAVLTVYVDFSGNAAQRRAVHAHFAGTLAYSCSVGGTHWHDLGGAGGLPGPKPTLFFAPAQIKKRAADWGADDLQRRIADAWNGFIARVAAADDPWLRVRDVRGVAAAETALRTLLDGRADPRDGMMLKL